MKRIIYSFVSLLFTIGVLITVSYAWFTNSEFVEPEISGYSAAAYFGGGDGSAEHPFQIKSKRHLYNLAWLQYLGKFNQPGSGNVPNSNNKTTLTQYSFVLDNNITIEADESNDWKLPPIGTTEYPFIGSLDGNGKTITGLTTTNKFDELSRHPGNVVEHAQSGTNQKEFGNAEIIGFIGTVGKIDGMEYSTYSISSESNNVKNLILKNTTVHTTTLETLCGIVAGYINGTVSNVGVVNGSLDIGFGTAIQNQDSVSSYTVAGYATENYLTKVSNNKTIVMNPTNYDTKEYVFADEGDTTGWGGSIDMYSTLMRINDIRNNYCDNSTGYVITGDNYFNYEGKPTLIGDEAESYYMYNSQYSKTGVTYNEKIGSFSYMMKGTETNYYNLLIAYLNSGHDNDNVYDGYKITDGTNCIKINANASISNTTNLDEATPFYFSSATDTSTTISTYIGQTLYYLQNNNGTLRLNTNSTTWNVYRGSDDLIAIYNGDYGLKYSNGSWRLVQVTQETSFKIYNGNYYLSYDNNHNITNGNANNAKSWNIDNNGRIYTVDNGTTYYLTATTSQLGLSTNINNARQWTATTGTSSGQTYYRYYFRDGRNNYYLRYSSSWKTGTSTYNLNRRFERTLYQEFTDNPETVGINYGGNDVTYLPLNVEDDYTPKSINTGYIIGGTRNNSESGAVRISRYGQYSSGTSQNIKNYNYTSKEFNPNSVKTVNNNGQVVTINDDDTSYVKFLESKAKLENIISKDTKGLYGLHFMNVPISMDSLITASYALVDGIEYPDGYQLPTSAIDFNLHSKGYVNFFAGTYGNYSGGGQDNCFFTVHQIFRDENNNIIAIREIKNVYSTNNEQASYVYDYGNNQYSAPYTLDVNGNRTYQNGYTKDTILNSLPSGYSLAFNTGRLGINSNVGSSANRYYAYYFEIPMNDGEFALGAVEDGTGAYLMYLDISANAQKINRTEVSQKSTVTQYDYAFPKGIAIIMDGKTIADIDAASSAVVKVLNAGTITLARTENTITATGSIPAAVNLTSTYISREVTLNDVSTAMTASAVKTTTSIYSQIQYIDHNVSTGDIFETNIQQIDNNNPTYNIYKIGQDNTTTGFDKVLIDQNATKPDWKLYAVKNGKNVAVNLNSSTDSNATDIINALKNIAKIDPISNPTQYNPNNYYSILEYDYDYDYGITNTYDIHINMVINSNDTTGKYYKFNGDDITITTNNTDGIKVYITYITTNNGTYTFNINGTQRTGTGNFTIA